MPNEIEIKFVIHDLEAVRSKLHDAGFSEVTARTHEFNTVYDTPESAMLSRGELLRLRQYGERWTLTHKGLAQLGGKHKTRKETETRVEDGASMHEILTSLGFVPRFRYEKYRTEFADSSHRGHIVLDETPIGNIGEIEGPADWIDEIARKLGISEADYITLSYATMFFAWRKRTGSAASEMTWAAVGKQS